MEKNKKDTQGCCGGISSGSIRSHYSDRYIRMAVY